MVRACSLSDGWLRTGDLATRNLLGLIRRAGRKKDVIKAGGLSVYVRELDEAKLAHPPVARAVACSVPHEEKREVPRRIWILEAGGLPHNGKVPLRELRKRYSRELDLPSYGPLLNLRQRDRKSVV